MRLRTKAFALTLLLAAQPALALPRFNPERCAFDSLAQWNEGEPLAGTARGRNEWLKVCSIGSYKTAFPKGNEFEPNSSRRAYITYGKITAIDENHEIVFDPGSWRAPTIAPESPGSADCNVPDDYDIVGYCTSGCVTPDQSIETSLSQQPILDMIRGHVNQVAVPVRASDDSLRSEVHGIRRFTKDLAATSQKIVVVTMVTGARLKLSQNHPLLTSDFRMKNADQLKVGDRLVSGSGSYDKIVSIEEQPYFGKLYNLSVETNDLSKSLYLVQGYVSGDKKFQDLSVSELNRKHLRSLAGKGL